MALGFFTVDTYVERSRLAYAEIFFFRKSRWLMVAQ